MSKLNIFGGLSLFALILLDAYLHLNIYYLGSGDGVGIFLLFGFFFVSIFVIAFRLLTNEVMSFKGAALLIALFILYFLLNIVLDTNSLDEMFAAAFGTTNGLVVFFAIGVLVKSKIDTCENMAIYERVGMTNFIKMIAFYFILTNAAGFWLLIDFFQRLRSDIFLIEGINDDYQRPGGFIVISFLISSLMINKIIMLKNLFPSKMSAKYFACVVVLFILNSTTLLLCSQMIGSNNAAVVILGALAIVLIVTTLSRSQSVKNRLSGKHFWLAKLIFSRKMLEMIMRIFLSCLIAVIFVYAGAEIFDFDLGLTRLGGHGYGDNQSINPRLDLIRENFWLHFSYSPVFGVTNIDCLTTGCGTYVHSVPLKLLTHTGVIGFSLFGLYCLLALRDAFFDSQYNCGDSVAVNNLYKIYNLLMMSFILLIGTSATSFIYSVLWFSFGLFLPLFKLRSINARD